MTRASDLAKTAEIIDTASYTFRNKVINGAMEIDQRLVGTSTTPGGGATYTLDRWGASLSQASKFSVQQNAGSVTPPTGFNNYLGVTSTSAYSVTSNDQFQVYHIIEGFNSIDFAWGTSAAKPATLSFWVRSSLTGTFGGSIATSKTTIWVFPFTYTISSANTWTYITVSVPATSSATPNLDNTQGIFIRFGLGSAGTQSGGTAGTWTSAGNYIQPAGTVSVVGTNGATWYITGVQFEVGSTATPFERRPYGQELALCQRYYEKSYSPSIVPGTANPNADGNTDNYDGMEWSYLTVSAGNAIFTGGNINTKYKVQKRAKPTIQVYNPLTGGAGVIRNFNTGTDITPTILSTTSVAVIVYVNFTAFAGVNFGYHYTAASEL